LPNTTSDKADREGWRRTTHPLFSQDGQPVWICPDCVQALRGILLNDKDHQEADLARAHEQKMREIQWRIADANEDYARKLDDLHRHYATMFGELKRKPETAT